MQRLTGLVVLIVAVLWLGLLPHAAIGFAAPAASDDSIAIIVNQSNPVENLSAAELRKILLGERSHWPNGRRITLVMLAPGQPERKAVLRDIYHMNESEFNNHFIQGLFTGEVFVSPKALGSAAEVRKFVFNVPGAIGYVKGSDTDSSVKVLRVDGHLPENKEYSIRMQAHSGK
jgi:ABC-type phosphate transport system substrate-binding protein